MAVRFIFVLGAFPILVLTACTRLESPPESKQEGDVEADTAYARQLFERANRLLHDDRYESALMYFELAAEHYKAANEWYGVVYCNIGKADCAIGLNEFEQARSILNLAKFAGEKHLGKSSPALGDVLSKLGWLRMKEGNYDLALEAHQMAFTIRVAAFGEQHYSVADTYNRLGLVHYFTGDYERAEDHLSKALDIRTARSSEQHQQLAAIHSNLGLLYRDMGRYGLAVEYLEKAIRTRRSAVDQSDPDMARTLKILGETHRLQGNYEEAFEAHHEALGIAQRASGGNQRLVANILNDLAIVHANTGNPEKAIPYYRRSLGIIKALLGNQHHEFATRLSGLGVAYLEIGDYDLAFRYLQNALRIRRAKFSENDRVVGIYLNNMGEVLSRKGDYSQARDYYEKALSSFIVSLGEQHPYVANQYKKLGGVMNRLGAHDEALAYLENALRIFRATSGEQDPYVATVYSTLGSVYDSLGATEQALEFHEQALNHVISAHGQHHPSVAARYNEIADVYRRKGSHDLALANYRRALTANQAKHSGMRTSDDGDATNILSDSDWLVSLWGKARALSKRSPALGSSRHHLEEALHAYYQAAQTLDRMQRRYQNQGTRLHWVEVAAPLMADAVDVSFALYETTGDEKYKALAFYFAEKNKGSVLLGALSDARARRFADIPDSLLRQERMLLASLVSTEQRLLNVRTGANQSASTDVERLSQDAFTFTQQHAALIEHIEHSYPNYYKLKYDIEVATPERVQTAGLDDETALIEYMLGEEEVFIFTLTTSDFDVVAVPRSPGLEHQVEELRRGIVEQKYETYTANARALYVQLLEPVISTLEARNLLIVPDGVLNYVPFESLLTETPNSSSVKNYARLPYLINGYAVSYAYSSTLLIETRNRERAEPDRDYVAFAPVPADGPPLGNIGANLLEKYALAGAAHPAGLGYLPMTHVEVKQIKKLFARTYPFFERFFSNKAHVYLGEYARETQVMSDEISRYRYVHFATHGFADPASPDASGIVLYGMPAAASVVADSVLLNEGEPDWSEDGILRLGEVYALRLNADVVVLSACETGFGPVARGEGILSLARGFLYAGASNVVASLWKADDLQTQRLMLGFYRNMLGGTATSSSLRSAKLNLIRGNSRYARPYYWATFVLIGA